jgi:uncharacterized protein (DUF697 family)
VPKLGDISSVWNTVRELNVGDIRDEAERAVSIIIIGERDARTPIVRALRGQAERFPARSAPSHRDVLVEYDLSLTRERQPEIQQGTLIILALDGNTTPSPELERVADKLSLVPVPLVGVCLNAVRLPLMANEREPDLGPIPLIFSEAQTHEQIADDVVPKLVEHLPEEFRIAAARQLPGFRDAVSRALIADTSFSNASFALTSSLPELIPILNIPLNAADMLVLTKNQALLVYKLGLANGAPPDFQAQLREIMPVIGTGFLWRQMARQLIGLIPGLGLVPKVAVAYGGTYATGQAAALWYSKGEAISPARLNELRKQAMAVGLQRARELIARRKNAPSTELAPPGTGARVSALQRIRGLLPGGKHDGSSTDDTKDE